MDNGSVLIAIQIPWDLRKSLIELSLKGNCTVEEAAYRLMLAGEKCDGLIKEKDEIIGGLRLQLEKGASK